MRCRFEGKKPLKCNLKMVEGQIFKSNIMKHMLKILPIIFILLVSCSADDVDRGHVDEIEKRFLPEKIVGDNGVEITYKYKGNKITEAIKKTESDGNSEFTIEYDDQDHIQKITEDYQNGDSTATIISKFSYNDNGMLSRKTIETAEDNEVFKIGWTETDAILTKVGEGDFAYEIFYDDKNPIKTLYTNTYQEKYDIIEEQKIDTYTYDDKYSMYKNIKGIRKIIDAEFDVFDVYFSKNNVTKIKWENKPEKEEEHVEFTYDYDDNDFPKRVKKINGTNSVNFEVTYRERQDKEL